jgi:hypothetical protein
MASQITLDWIRRIKKKYETVLLSKKNVVSVGIGFKEKDGQVTDQMALIVSVEKKQPANQVSDTDLIPAEIEGVPVDVKEIGIIRALNQGSHSGSSLAPRNGHEN